MIQRDKRAVLAWTMALVSAFVAATSSAAPTAAEKCSASKIKAAGSAVYSLTKCEQKAIADETTVDPDCVSSSGGKLTSAFEKAEGKGGCLVTGDVSSVQSLVDACVASYAGAISGDTECAAAKMKATGKKTGGKAKCEQKGYLNDGSVDPLCLSKVEGKFTTAIAKADTLGTCTDTAVVLEALVDDCMSQLTEDPPVVDACTLNDNTTETAVEHPDGCNVLERDTSACDASRTSQGLDGYWLKFSCRVTLTKGPTTVTAESDGQPDYLSNYFPNANDCHEVYTDAIQNPNLIAAQDYTVGFPLTPNTTPQSMSGMIAVVGMAINGVPIFGNFAAPGDNIFEEALTFDRCGAHPQQTGKYHYHSEPYAITYDDSSFVGVMRDGYPIYGRRDTDDMIPVDLDAQGGHTGVTVDSPVTPVYHYHINEQINPEDPMDAQWFITTGTYHGTPGATCTGC